ncbi:Guanylate kinase-associated protein mars [Anthophora retusa]
MSTFCQQYKDNTGFTLISVKSAQDKGEQLSSGMEDRMTRLLKWKVERERQRKLEQIKKKPPFVVGVVHHKIWSPITIHEKVCNKFTTISSAPPQKRITSATEKRLTNKALTHKIIKDPFKNPSGINQEKRYQKDEEQSFTFIDNKFKAPAELLHVPLFGKVAIQITPAKTNKLMFSSSRISMAEKQSSNVIFNIKPVEIKKHDSPSNEKESSNDDAGKTFNFSYNNTNSNDKGIKSEDENVVYNSEEHTIEEHNNEEHSNKEHNSRKHSSEEHNGEVHNCTMEVSSSLKNSISTSLKSDSLREPVLFSHNINCSYEESNIKKEQQLKDDSSLSHLPSDDIPTKDTTIKNLNTSDEEEKCTAKNFQFLLHKEITRFNEICKTWAKIKATPEITEDGQYEINQTIGQTNLLLSKKFERFRGLVADYETGKEEMLVEYKDLQGFWDMMYIEVKNCHSRFKKLKELHSQDWKEKELFVSKPIAKKRFIARKNVVSTKSSSIRAFLAEKKRKMVHEMRNNDNTKEVEVTTNPILSNKYEKNKSSNIKYETKESMSSISNEKDYAPIKRDKKLHLSQKIKNFLIIIKVSQMCKTSQMHLDDTISYDNSFQALEKSTLKPTKSAITVESHMQSTNKVNFNDHVTLNEISVDEKPQSEMNFTGALSRIDSVDFDNPDEIIIKAERKLVFDDNSSEESEQDIGYFEPEDFTIKNISKLPTIQIQSSTPLLRSKLDKNLSTPSPSRRQNIFDKSNKMLCKISPLEEIAYDANLDALTTKLQKHVFISDKQDTSEYGESIKVLRNRIVATPVTHTVKKKSLKEMSTSIQESEYKENETPSDRRKRTNSLKGSTSDKERMDSHNWIENMSLRESSARRKSTRNVKFLGMDSCQ